VESQSIVPQHETDAMWQDKLGVWRFKSPHATRAGYSTPIPSSVSSHPANKRLSVQGDLGTQSPPTPEGN
jgi:hypothetical protein